MESERVTLHKSLVDDIIKGLEQVEQLEVSSPSRQRMLPCYQEALFLLTGRRGQCHSPSSHSDPPPAGSSSLKRKFREDTITMCHKIITSGKDSDDGYKWRMNGTQGSEFPRRYYRCIERGCSATKQLRRSHIDTTKFEVTYSGKHTCLGLAGGGGGASAEMRELVENLSEKRDEFGAANESNEWVKATLIDADVSFIDQMGKSFASLPH